MARRVGMCRLTAAAALAVMFLAAVPAGSAPHGGEEFELRQPDGSLVRVRVFGDEFYQDVESPDGFTLVRGEGGWICYAELSADGAEYVSTGVRYTDGGRAPGVRRKLRVSGETVRARQRANREAVGFDGDSLVPRRLGGPRRGAAKAADGVSPAAAEARRIVGLTVLINFPAGVNPRDGAQVAAVTSNVSRGALEEFCNREGGYLGTNGAGSVRDYFLDVSNSLLDYSNVVAPFVTVQYPKNYYDTLTNYTTTPYLLQSALGEIKKLAESGQLDLSGLTTEGTNNTVTALNVLYAGSAGQGWSNGIWPHSGTYRAPSGSSAVTISVGGRSIRFGRYQLASLGTGASPPGIGTFVHENGHMVMRWPDLYNYDNTVTNVVASYCVMGSSNGSNPQMPNPHFRAEAGWIGVTDITGANATLAHAANSHEAFRFARNDRESYMIEARRRTGRSAGLPGEGLLIWHVHRSGSNTALDSRNPFPMVKLVQANIAASTAQPFVAAPTANAPFRAAGGTTPAATRTEFSRVSAPAALYHDGTPSNIDISEISAVRDVMSFRVGSGSAGPPRYLLTVEGGSGSGLYLADTVVAISAPDTNAAGRVFMRWNSAEVEPLDLYARATTVATIAAEAAVAAVFARAFALPGRAEADTFGLARGITGGSNTSNGATGNRIARIRDSSRFAEYVVDIAEGGNYRLSYRLLTSSSSRGGFVLRDMTNGALLDSVAVPVPSSSRASMQTVEGAVAALKGGRAVWRLEPFGANGANYDMDWFGAELAAPPSVSVRAAAAAPLRYGVWASPSGSVRFSVPAAGHVRLRMYDVRGRMVATLHDGAKGPGAYSVSVSKHAGGIGRGLYIIRMESGGYSGAVRVRLGK